MRKKLQFVRLLLSQPQLKKKIQIDGFHLFTAIVVKFRTSWCKQEKFSNKKNRETKVIKKVKRGTDKPRDVSANQVKREKAKFISLVQLFLKSGFF